jgi:hypothetical protein
MENYGNFTVHAPNYGNLYYDWYTQKTTPAEGLNLCTQINTHMILPVSKSRANKTPEPIQ